MKRILKHLTFFLPLLSHLPSYFCSIINHSLILLLSFLFFSSLSKFCPSSLFPLPTADLLTHSTINISQHYIYIYIIYMCVYVHLYVFVYLCVLTFRGVCVLGRRYQFGSSVVISLSVTILFFIIIHSATD